MVKILNASAENGKVTAEGVEVQGTIFGAGVKASTGILILDGALALYIASNSSDVKELIEKTVEIVDQLKTIATTIDAATNSPGGATAAIAQLTVMNMELNQMKDMLT